MARAARSQALRKLGWASGSDAGLAGVVASGIAAGTGKTKRSAVGGVSVSPGSAKATGMSAAWTGAPSSGASTTCSSVGKGLGSVVSTSHGGTKSAAPSISPSVSWAWALASLVRTWLLCLLACNSAGYGRIARVLLGPALLQLLQRHGSALAGRVLAQHAFVDGSRQRAILADRCHPEPRILLIGVDLQHLFQMALRPLIAPLPGGRNSRLEQLLHGFRGGSRRVLTR